MISEQVTFERLNASKIKDTAFRCFHPKRIYNKYINDHVYVNCRTCDGCLSARATELSLRVSRECKQHTYALFFTLTYDNEHLPVMRWHSGNLFLGNRPIGTDSHGNFVYPSIDVTDIEDFDLSSLVPTNYPDITCFAYACKYDVQKFIMRLRTHLYRNQEWKYKKDSNNNIVRYLGVSEYTKPLSKDEKKLRFFICAEYGPQYFRPHYHGIVWTDCEPIVRYLQRNILEDWSLGSKTLDAPTLVNSSAPQYVAKYVNGNTLLPKVLQHRSIRTFFVASKNPVIGDYKSDFLTLGDALINGTVESLQPIDKQNPSELAFVPISKTVLSRYFPKCQGWRTADDFRKLSLIEKYSRGFYDVKREVKIGTDKTKVLIHSDHDFYHYLISNDYKYQDYRFVKLANFWCSRDIKYPERKDGVLTGRVLSSRLSYEQYIACLNRLYSNLELLVLRGFYLSQNKFVASHSSVYNGILNLVSFYPNIFYELPFVMSEEEYTDSRFDDFFSSFGFGYDTFYRDGFINDEFINFVNSDVVTALRHSHISYLCRDSLKNKKFNEHIYEL